MLPISTVAQRLALSRRASPGIALAILLLVFGAVWLTVLAGTALVAPVDNIEQLTWVRSLEWGYYKHPPLPTFLLWLPVHVLGLSGWTSYLLGAAVTLGTMAILWRLLRELRGTAYATLALLATLCITYYNGRLYYYNHNIVLMLCSTGIAWLAWRAFATRQLRWWLAIGAVVGLGGLAKYQIAVTVASLGCFWLAQHGWRDAVQRRGPIVAAAIALVVLLPHLVWLVRNDLPPIRYAMHTSLGVALPASTRAFAALRWVADQALNRGLPALLMLAVADWSAQRSHAAATSDNAPGDRRDAARALLISWGAVPLGLMTLMGATFGSDLQLQWGTPFLLFLAPCVMELFPRAAWRRPAPAAVWTTFAGIQTLLIVLTIVTSPVGIKRLMDTHWRTFDAKRFAERVAGPARRALGGPVRVIVGSAAEPGALALELPEHPLVLIDGRYDRSPWVRPETVTSCGALEIVRSHDPLPDATPFGAPFDGLQWRVIRPMPGSPPCRTPAAD
ncbi:MAG: glycosyltransferase family 39 protein [Rhizobacter sp.]